MTKKVVSDNFSTIMEEISTAIKDEKSCSFRKLALAAGLNPGLDFRGASLRDLDFRDEDLRFFDFSGADLAGADFRRAILDGANFEGADLRGAIGIQNKDLHHEVPLELNDMIREAKQQILRGSVPNEEWWPYIERLRLGNSGIENIKAIKPLLALKELSLKRTTIANISDLSNLQNLTRLSLDGTNVRDLSPISNLLNWLILRWKALT